MIKRSAGLPVVVGSIPYVVGGGYEGKTRELDDIVKQEAELLTNTFGKDVEIRFNSDQEGGGAWLVNSLKEFDGNCQVGLGAGLVSKTPEGMTRQEFLVNSTTGFIRKQPKEIWITTCMKASALKNPNIANEGNPNSRYCWLVHKTVQDAITWLVENIDTKKICK